jgi:hypothetical protein
MLAFSFDDLGVADVDHASAWSTAVPCAIFGSIRGELSVQLGSRNLAQRAPLTPVSSAS